VLKCYPEGFFGAAPGEGDARSAVAVVVDEGNAVRAFLLFEAYGCAARPESCFVFEYFDVLQLRLQSRAAA
jgi:hypothetical protein